MIASQYKVAIIGAGEIGRAIGGVIGKNCPDVNYWDADPARVEDQKQIAEVVSSAQIVFLCVPSWAMRSAAQEIYNYLEPEAVVVSLAKGMEASSHKFMDELLTELLPQGQRFGLLGGPMIAEEVKAGLAGYAVLGSINKEVYEIVAPLFVETNIKIQFSDDPKGVALAGVLKNIFTLAIGLEEHYQLGTNVRGALIADSLKEMRAINAKLGGKEESITGLAGLGDLLATAMTSYSLNRQAAEELAKTGELKTRSEGTASLESMIYRLEGQTAEYPILKILGEVILNKAQPKSIFTKLIDLL